MLLFVAEAAIGMCRVFHGLLFVLRRLKELLELLMNRLGHLWQVAIVLPSQMSLQHCDLLVELVQVEFRLLMQF